MACGVPSAEHKEMLWAHGGIAESLCAAMHWLAAAFVSTSHKDESFEVGQRRQSVEKAALEKDLGTPRPIPFSYLGFSSDLWQSFSFIQRLTSLGWFRKLTCTTKPQSYWGPPFPVTSAKALF